MSEASRPAPVPDEMTRLGQATAANPDNSAWVSANAGSGKTWVLSTRVIRLLLRGVDPAKILCLTYTKTAAAEMKNRVFERLGKWVTLDDGPLARELMDIAQGEKVDPAFARTLFAKALETPGGLKIQTIHAFCEAILHRFPLEANVAGHFEVLDAEGASVLIAEARRQVLAGQADLAGVAVDSVLDRSGENGLENLLEEIVQKRHNLSALIEKVGDSRAERTVAYRRLFSFSPNETSESLAEDAWPLPGFDATYVHRLDTAARAGKSERKTHTGLAGKLRAAADMTEPLQRLQVLRSAFLKSDDEVKTQHMFPDDILDVMPDFEAQFRRGAATVRTVVDRVNLFREIDSTLDALDIADALLAIYSRLKAQRGYLDFEDMIVKTSHMLQRADVAAWVRLKLDQGIDHILVDEAQDTSPAQWAIIKTLASEFFDGDGARDARRTVFAVGDRKQSIYSFQGADPDEFDKAQEFFAGKLTGVDRAFEKVPLVTSFRSTAAVLQAVDIVFDDEDNRRGVSGLAPVRHRSLRSGETGVVEVWETIRAKAEDLQEDWREPVDEADLPAVKLARKITEEIVRWTTSGTSLHATGKPIRAGDILILVRQRDAFMHALSRRLKEEGVPVAGADRLALVDHIAVQDMMALGRVLLNRRDDLSLAALLRSPLFAISEDQLHALAHGRGPQSLRERLDTMAAEDNVLAAARDTLDRWQAMAARVPVFELYSHVLGEDGGCRKLVARLGPETSDMLDEFLTFILAREMSGPLSLETFLHTLEHFGPEIKRDMQQGAEQVRIMTVHGAKGLEAPVVFLVDPGSRAHNSARNPLLLAIPDIRFAPDHAEDGATVVLSRGDAKSQSRITQGVLATIKERAEEEYRRLLYVGMTRAADRLVVCGFAGKRDVGDTWSTMVTKAIAEKSDRTADADGLERLRFPKGVDDTYSATLTRAHDTGDVEIPALFAKKAPKEPPPLRPLIPSGASGVAAAIDKSEADTASRSLLADGATWHGGARLQGARASDAIHRGTMTHRLLQMLPDMPTQQRLDAARRYCRFMMRDWTDGDCDRFCEPVFAILSDPRFGHLFTPSALAEVPVIGTLDFGGKPRGVSGVIDRLSVDRDAVHLVDYKTNNRVPDDTSDVDPFHLRQMSLYRALVRPLYPGKRLVTSLLYTNGPRMISLPDDLLDAALASVTDS